MANKKVRIRPPANDYADVLHPETTASVVIEETNKRFMTDAERTKLSGVEAGANKYTHPTGTNPHGTTKADVGLENAENKSSVTIRGEITSANVTSALGFTPLNNAIKGKPSGVAELDSGGKVLSTQLPSYVDDVLEFNSLANFPSTGEAGKIYVSKDTNLAYRWSGSAYTVISPSLALGETTATAYRGDRGKTAYDHSQLAHAPSNAQKNSAITKAEIEAKLTGEVTTHSHQMSGVTGLATALSGKVDNSQVLTNVPSGAKFTDTVTTVNGKTGAIAKADIVALGIPASDNNTTYSEITTAEIDAGTASTLRTITGRRVKHILDKVRVTGGVSTFAGNNLEKTIAHGLGATPLSAYAFPTENPQGFLGEVWIRFDATHIYVGNTGSYVGAMTWTAVPKGV